MSTSEHLLQDGRLLPAACAAWAAMWVATLADWRWWAAGVAMGAVIGVLAWVRRSWPLAAVALVVLACISAGSWRTCALAGHDLAKAADARHVITANLQTVGDVRIKSGDGPRPALTVIDVDVMAADLGGRQVPGGVSLVVLASGPMGEVWRTIAPGSHVRAVLRLAPAEPGERVVAMATPVAEPAVLAGPGLIDRAVEMLRAGLRQAASGLPGEARSLVPALVVGDVTAMPPELTDNFRTTGLTHLAAVSGSNLTIALAFLLIAARWVGVRGWWLRGLGFAGVLGFVSICRSEPSVLRAAAMGLVALAAIGLGSRDRRALRHLAVAMIGLLLLDPFLSRSLGFALSVCASAGLVIWSGRWEESLATWLPRWVATAISVPLAAQLATQPLTTAISGKVSLVGLVANVFAGPLVGPATVLGVAALLLWWWPWAASIVLIPAGWCANGIVWIARTFAGFPGAAWPWSATASGVVAVATLCLGLGLAMAWLLRHRWLALVLAVVMVVALLRPAVRPGWPPPAWSVVMCDVGQGDALVLRAAPDAAVLVDTGPEPAALERCLTSLGITRVPLLVLSHDHADHVGGLAAVLRREVGTILLSSVPSGNRPHLLSQLGQREVQIATDEHLRVGDVEWETLPGLRISAVVERSGEGESSAENDGSIIAFANVGGLRVLLTGDLESAGQAWAREHYDVGCDVLKTPHHGSGRYDAEFFAAAHPRVALISAGIKNDYGHPAPTTVRKLAAMGATVVRTDQRGSIALVRVDDHLQITTERESSAPVDAQNRKR